MKIILSEINDKWKPAIHWEGEPRDSVIEALEAAYDALDVAIADLLSQVEDHAIDQFARNSQQFARLLSVIEEGRLMQVLERDPD